MLNAVADLLKFTVEFKKLLTQQLSQTSEAALHGLNKVYLSKAQRMPPQDLWPGESA